MGVIVTTGLTIGEISKLESRLVNAGELVEANDPHGFLSRADDWYKTNVKQGNKLLSADHYVRLWNRARSSDNPKVRTLALGALSYIHDTFAQYPNRARFGARFALNRIANFEGLGALWSGVRIHDREESEARILFDIAKGDRSFSDQQLEEKVEGFVLRHGGEGGVLADFAFDLGTLVEAVRDTNPERSETARAGLTYFALASDAIPDDSGTVGLLDDICVVRWAVEELWPERAIVSDRLDLVAARWPFLRDVLFKDGDQPYPVSEFAAINTSMALVPSSQEQSIPRVAIVSPDLGQSSVILGFLMALTSVREQVEVSDRPRFESGERLINRQTKAEALFRGYRHLSDPRTDCPANEADAFAIEHEPGKKHGGKCLRYLPLSQLGNFQRSPKTTQKLKQGTIGLDQQDIPLGPVERLFGATTPVVHPASRKTVLVVAPLGAAQDLLSGLSVYGVPLIDTIPTGRAQLTDGDPDFDLWTRHGAGGRPYLAIVRTMAEARDIAEEDPGRVAAVVGPARPESPDPSNLALIAGQGIPVLGLIDPNDRDAMEVLEQAGFSFWSWDEAWLRTLRWPAIDNSQDSHRIASTERHVRAAFQARCDVVDVPWTEFDALYSALDGIGRTDNEQLEIISHHGFTLLLRAARRLKRLDDLAKRDFRRLLEGIRDARRSGQHFWSAELAEQLARLEDASVLLIRSLESGNPKVMLLLEWVEANPEGIIVTNRSSAQELRNEFGEIDVRSLDDVHRKPPANPVLIPAWYSRGPMGRLLFPPRVLDVTLLLHAPERQWFGAGADRYNRGVQCASAKASGNPGISFGGLERRRTPVVIEREPVPVAEPDDYIVHAARATALGRLRAVDDETVEAKLVGFRGGSWAAFTPNHTLQSVSHLIGMDSENWESAALLPVHAKDVRRDDVLILLRGSDSDAIRVAVDEKRPGLREISAEWRRALSRYLLSGHTLPELSQELERHGCRRHTATIKGWIRDDTVIRPRHGNKDIDAILAVTKDEILGSRLAKCKKAVDVIWKAHHQVARELARRVLDHLGEWLAAGIEPRELVEVEDRVVLVTVDSVDQESIEAPRSMVNRLQDP